MSSESDRFLHGDFWDRYSRSWDEEVRPRIDGEILGDEWTRPARTRFIFERFAAPYLRESASVVEIGPGGGKFSRMLVERCGELILVDISGEMLRRANQACGGRAREVIIEDGALEGVESGSVDLVFSYDVFIHLESEEVFRYLAEVNRILRPDGVFSIHTSTFESRWGLHSYLQQLRDHQPNIGRRYGGRMYPMSEAILRRFAEHSGFSVIDVLATHDDKDIILALRRVRPARPWAFVTTPELYQRYELSERVGGSNQREIYAGSSLFGKDPCLLLVGDAEDPHLVAIAHAQPPPHPCLAAPQDWETLAGFGIVRFQGRDCQSLPQILASEARPLSDGFAAAVDGSYLKELGRLFEGLLAAHSAGLAHGEIAPEFILRDGTEGNLELFGLVAATESSGDEVCLRDLAAMAPIVSSVAKACGSGAVAEVAPELRDSPTMPLAERVIQLMMR